MARRFDRADTGQRVYDVRIVNTRSVSLRAPRSASSNGPLAKPVRPDELLAALAEVLQRTP